MRWCMLHDGVLGFRNGARDFHGGLREGCVPTHGLYCGGVHGLCGVVRDSHGGVCGLRGAARELSVIVRVIAR